MNNFTNDSATASSMLASMAVGVSFFLCGFSGILINGITLFGITANRELRGAFYFFSINCLLADMLGLLSVGCYLGLSLTLQNNLGQFTQFVLSGLQWTSWFSKLSFLVCISATRLQAVKRKTMNDKRVGVWSWIFIFIVWVFNVCFFNIVPAFGKENLAQVDFDRFFWKFNTDHFFVSITYRYLIICQALTSILLIVLNGCSLYCYKKHLYRVTTVLSSDQTAANRKKEINMFFQCIGTSTYFIIGCFVYLIFRKTMHEEWKFMLQFIMLSLHVDSSIVYLCMNRNIRQGVIDGLKTLSVRIFH